MVWSWDRLDAYGRFVQGAQHASVEVDYVYPGTFGATPNFGAYPAGTLIGGNRTGREISIDRNYDVVVGGVDQDLLGFGGWTISPEHVFDLGSGMLERGDGVLQTTGTGPGSALGSVRTVAGTRTFGSIVTPMDGSSPLGVHIYPYAIAVGHDGSTYIGSVGDGLSANLYQVTPPTTAAPAGKIYTVAGHQTVAGGFVNGENAVGAPLSFGALAIDRDDSIVAQDSVNPRIVRISAAALCIPTGSCDPIGRTVSLVAGTGVAGYLDGPAATAQFGSSATSIAIASDGTIYVGDKGTDGVWRIRRIRGGIVDTIAGKSAADGGVTYSGDTQVLQAVKAQLGTITGLAVDSAGSVYFAEYGDLLRKITPDGYVTHIAGDGVRTDPANDGVPASTTYLGTPGRIGVAIDSHDRLYISDTSHCTIRTIGSDGIIERYAGTALTSGNCLGVGETPLDGAAPQATRLATPDFIAIGPDDSLTFSASGYESVRTVAGLGGIFRIPSADGREVYSFSDNQHIETLSALTGAGLLKFCYDTTGLTQIIDETCASSPVCGTDYAGCQTKITRTSSTVTITSPFSQTTTLSLTSFGSGTGAESLASTVTDFSGKPFGLTYRTDTNGWTGLLATFADPGNVALLKHHSLTYSSDGYLKVDQDPLQFAGGNNGQTLNRSWFNGGWSVDYASAEGRTRHFTVDATPSFSVAPPGTIPPSSSSFPQRVQHRTSQPSDGTTYTEDWYNDGSRTLTMPDSTVVATSFSADPRLGWGGRYASNTNTTTGTGLGARLRKEYRSAVVPANSTDPFTTATSELDQVEINPSNATDPTAFDASRFYSRAVTYGTTPTIVYKTPMGRSVTETFDSFGRLKTIHVPATGANFPSGGLADITITPDTHGRVDHIDQGTSLRHHQYGYYTTGANTNGLLNTVSDTINGSMSYDSYDGDGRVTQTTLPGPTSGATWRKVLTSYDASAKKSTIVLPNGASSTHNFTDNDDNFLATYDPPLTAPKDTTYNYDFDRLLGSFLTPDSDKVTYTHDAAGRVTSRTGAANATFTYDASGKLHSETANGITYTYAYNGSLLTTVTTSGLFSRAITYGYPSTATAWAQQVTTRQLDTQTGAADAIGRDYDDLVTSFAAVSLVNRDSDNGALLGTTVNGFSDSYKKYNQFGELLEYDANASGTVYKEVLVRDQISSTLGGRIHTKTETVNGGTAVVHTYTYDTANRLISDGAALYSYDNDGNRLDLCATYDAQDRFGCGSAYTPDGRMTKDGLNGYTYDALGNLTTATVPVTGGTTYTYTVDSQNRRVRKAHGAVIDQQFLYGVGRSPVAELDPTTGAPKWIFYYATGRNVPDYMLRPSDSHIFKLITDHAGSVRVVYDTTAASTAQIIDYDAWGIATAETGTGLQPLCTGTAPNFVCFQPFGFAGGIQDWQTQLVRFGARDYNPRLGRWMTKDGSRFRGGLNFYEYVHDDPVNFIDPSGRWEFPAYPGDIPPGWAEAPVQWAPNSIKYVHPSGEWVRFDQGNGGNGPAGPDHWHWSGNPKFHYYPGASIPDPPDMCTNESQGGDPYYDDLYNDDASSPFDSLPAWLSGLLTDLGFGSDVAPVAGPEPGFPEFAVP